MWKTYDLTTWVRALLAIGVIWITFDLARQEPQLPAPAGAAASLESPLSSGGSLAGAPIQRSSPGTRSSGGAAMAAQPPPPTSARQPCVPVASDKDKKESKIPKEWEAIFVLVVAFYFSDRPRVEAFAQAPGQSNSDKALAELLLQFLLGLALIALTVCLFTVRVKGEFRPAVDGAWIAGVALAVGFYFKQTGTPFDTDILPILRATLALLAIASSLVMCIVRGGHDIPIIPLQWISLVFIVVAFYFKERQ
jgi:hypothetical protein